MNASSAAINIDIKYESLVFEFAYNDIQTFKFDSNESTLGLVLLVDSALTDPEHKRKEVSIKLPNRNGVKGNKLITYNLYY